MRGKLQLTQRQRDVLKRVQAGDVDKEIATALGLSVTTVRTHLRRIYQHNGVRNRTEAVAALISSEVDGVNRA